MPRPGISKASIWSNDRPGRPGALTLLAVGSLVLLLSSLLSPPVAAEEATLLASLPSKVEPAPAEYDFVLMSLWVDQDCLTDELEARAEMPKKAGDETRFFLPLLAICTSLELEVKGEAKGVISVGVPGSGRCLTLDAAKGQLTLNGRPATLNPQSLQAGEGEVYVTPEVLGQWLDCEFQTDRATLSIKVKTMRPFPAQEREQREARAAKLRGSTPEAEGGPAPLEAKYQSWAGPFVDQTLTLSAGRSVSLTSYTRISGDVLKAGYDLTLNASANGSPTARLMFSRYDPDAHLLGPLRATALTGGELSSPALPLVASAQQVRGLSLSSYPLTSNSLFDRRSITGFAGPDWDAQLYRGEVLLDYQKTDANGRWEFREVPLLYGDNNLRVILHGPHGEMREEQLQASVGAAVLQPGKRYYRFVAGQQEGGGNLVALQGDWSLRRDLSLAYGAADVEFQGEGHQYLTAGLRGYRGRVFGTLDLAAERGGGQGLRSSLQTRLGQVSAAAEYSQIWDLGSQVIGGGSGDSGHQVRLHLDNLPMPDKGFWLPAALEWQQESYASGRRHMELTSRLSAARAPWRFSSFLTWTRDGAGADNTEDLKGSLLASRYNRDGEFTCDLSYTLLPTVQVDNATLAYRMELDESRTLSLSVQHTPPDSRTRLEAGLSRRQGSRSWGVTAGLDSESGVFLGASISASFGRLPYRDWQQTPEALTGQATAMARVFLDKNGNGRLAPGEPPLKDVGFFVNDSSGRAVTDARGVALLSGFPAFESTRLSVSRSTLEDSMWVPRQDSVVLRARPGAIVCVDMAVSPTGEVNGTVYAQRSGQRCPAPAVELELVNEKGEVVKTSRTAYDGFFSFSEVPVGSYMLRTKFTESMKAAYRQCERKVIIEGDDPFVDGADLNLEPTGDFLAAQARAKQEERQ